MVFDSIRSIGDVGGVAKLRSFMLFEPLRRDANNKMRSAVVKNGSPACQGRQETIAIKRHLID